MAVVIRTKADRLVEYVQAKPGVKLEDAAKAVGLTPERAERLAQLLAEHGLMDVNFGLLHVTLRIPSTVPAATEERSARRKKGPGAEKAHAMEMEVMTSQGLMAFFEKDLQKRIGKAKTLLEELRNRHFTQEELDDVRGEVDMALGQLAAYSSELAELILKENAFKEELLAYQRELQTFQPSRIPQPTPKALDRFLHWIASVIQALAERIRPKPPVEPPLPPDASVTFQPPMEQIAQPVRRTKRKEDGSEPADEQPPDEQAGGGA